MTYIYERDPYFLTCKPKMYFLYVKAFESYRINRQTYGQIPPILMPSQHHQ